MADNTPEFFKNLTCPKCGRRLKRVHKYGEILCNSCDEPIVEDGWDNEKGRKISYTKCPNKKCRADILNPGLQSVCPRCLTSILVTDVNGF